MKQAAHGYIAPTPVCANDPFKDMAASVLALAVSDWRRLGALRSVIWLKWRGQRRQHPHKMTLSSMGYTSPRQELLDFFYSGWCELMLGALGFDRDWFLTNINVPLPED